MSYGEPLFLEAEVAAHRWISGNAGELYAAAITGSMQRVGIDQAAIDACLAQPRVASLGGTAGLQRGAECEVRARMTRE